VGGRGDLQVLVSPLHFFHQVQSGVDDELVHVLCFIAEAGDAIAADFGGAEVEFEERVVAGADYGEVVGHCHYVKLSQVFRSVLK